MTVRAWYYIPTAGNNFTLICTVVSDLPASIMWIGPDGPIASQESITIAQTMAQTITGRETLNTLSIFLSELVFHPLQASHGATYTCNSIVDVASARRNASQAYQLRVQSKSYLDQTLSLITCTCTRAHDKTGGGRACNFHSIRTGGIFIANRHFR